TNGALVFVSGGGDSGRIEVFQLDRAGNLLDANGMKQSCPDTFSTCGQTPSDATLGAEGTTAADCPAGVSCQPPTTCGGTTAGQFCVLNRDCPNDRACKLLQTCGGVAGPACSQNSECGLTCGGSASGQACTSEADCASGIKCKRPSCQPLAAPMNPTSLRRGL